MLHLINKQRFQCKIKKYALANENKLIFHTQNSIDLITQTVNKSKHYFVYETEFDRNQRTILFVTHEASITGAPVLSLNIIRELKLSYNVILLALAPGRLQDDFIKNSNCAIIVENKSYCTKHFLYSLYCDNIKKYKPFISILNSAASDCFLKTTHYFELPSVLLVHEFAYTLNSDEINNMSLATFTIFSSKFLLDTFKDTFNIKHLNYEIIPQGDSDYKIQSSEASNENFNIISKLVELNKSYKICACIGIGKMRKGLDLFLITASEVNKRVKNSFFIWIGDYDSQSDSNGTFDCIIESEKKTLSINSRILFIKPFRGLDFIFPYISVLVNCSRLDPLPNVVMMSMRYKKPFCLFDNTSGYSEILRYYSLENFCIARYLDAYDLAAKIVTLLNNKEIYKLVSNKVYDILRKNYSMKQYCSKLISLFERVVAIKKLSRKDAVN